MSRFGLPALDCDPVNGTCNYTFGRDSYVTPAGYDFAVVNVPQFRPFQFGGNAVVPKPVNDSPLPLAQSTTSGVASMTDQEFIASLYQGYYRRAPDAPGLAFWVGQLQSGAHTRASAENAFRTSPDMSPDSSKTLAQYLAGFGLVPGPVQTATVATTQAQAAGLPFGLSSQTLLLLGLGLAAIFLLSGDSK